MFSTSSSELSQKDESLQIKQDDKFFSRLLSRETSMANPSFRVYHGVSVAVPFVWESQPGTPKLKSHDSTLPPLTPPPSYYTNHDQKPARKRSGSNPFHLFPRIGLLKKASRGTSFDSGLSYDDEATHIGSITYPLCFGFGKGSGGMHKGRCHAYNWSS